MNIASFAIWKRVMGGDLSWLMRASSFGALHWKLAVVSVIPLCGFGNWCTSWCHIISTTFTWWSLGWHRFLDHIDTGYPICHSLFWMATTSAWRLCLIIHGLEFRRVSCPFVAS